MNRTIGALPYLRKQDVYALFPDLIDCWLSNNPNSHNNNSSKEISVDRINQILFIVNPINKAVFTLSIEAGQISLKISIGG